MIGSWGVRGWVKVRSYGDDPGGLVAQRTWWIAGPDGDWQARSVGEARVHSGNVVAALDGVGDPEAAAMLKGRAVAVQRSALPSPGESEVYLADLVGLEVRDASGRTLGTVVAMEDYGAHPVMKVRMNSTHQNTAGGDPGGESSAERLVPFVQPIVRSVDLAARLIEVDWDPGF